MRRIGKKANLALVCLLVMVLLPVMGYRMTEAKTKVSVKSVVFTKDIGETLNLFVGQSYQLKAKVKPSNASNKRVAYVSSDSEIVTVSSNGMLKAVKKGTVMITVKAKDGSGEKAVITVNSKVRVRKVTITEPADQDLVLIKGKTYAIITKVTPADADNKGLSYSSSNSKVATVSSAGEIAAKRSGNAVITVTAKDGSGKTDTLKVTIVAPVTAINLAESNVKGKVGSSYQVLATVMPDDATNKKLAYNSSDTSLATVDESGMVSLKKEGNVIITVTTTDETNITAAVTITIAPAAQVNTAPIIGDTPAQSDPYKLVWQDEFSGDTLNTADWNYELHEPGWVNNELQRYIDSADNIFVRDGKLVIKAIKTEGDNGTTYTSGRVNTQGKHDFKYGRFEVKAKMTKGQGFLPAIWMMPTNENIYGQWPKCGEIDIAEVLGNQTNKTYGTLHFGEPHTQKQGSYTLTNGDYSSGYHVYTAEWEPNEIRYYVDGILYYTVSDWFSKRTGFKEVTYPAPFDQPFYLILNLAVGGNWPGNPDQTTPFDENAELSIDYVKVYQKDSYNENVQKPVSNITFRNPDATGNYINNGDFSVKESLIDSNDWGFLLAGTGTATANISGNELHINTTNSGNLNYSIQAVQPNLPIEKGYRYRLTFDSSAAADRTMIVDLSAPDNGYIRYLADTTINLTTVKQSYSYEFDMLSNSDANGRVEFNLGNQGSTAPVTIGNVRLVKIGPAEIPPEVKSVLPDGNFVYNGEFQEGTNRLEYWNIQNQCYDAKVEVTSVNNSHELKATVPSSVTGLDQVMVQQDPVAISGGKKYELSFDAYGDSNQTIRTTIAGNQFDTVLTSTKTTYKYTFTTDSGLTGGVLEILLGVAGTTYIDNVRVQEDSLLLNGDFSNNFTGFEVFTDGGISSQVTYVVDGLTENNAAVFDIKDSGDQDWKIQLKQNNIKLENGKWYKIKLDAKASMNRAIMYALQRDGSKDNNWTPYSGSKIINLTNTYQTFTTTFQMTSTTDPYTILSISLGSVGGTRITTRHQVYIDNITLDEVKAPSQNPVQEGTEMIKNGNFSSTSENWNIMAISAPGAATVTFPAGKVSYDITNPGDQDWNVQLKQSGLLLENGASYSVTFKIKSTQARTIKFAFLNATYDWYGGSNISLNADEEQTVTQTIAVTKQTDPAIDFVISMGKIGDTPASTIEISNVSIIKIL